MRGSPGGLESVNLLDLAPVRTASWRDEGGVVVVERRPAAPRGLLGHLVGVFLPPRTRRRRLDEIGSAVWRRLDGRTVAEVAACLREEFGERVEPLEERLRLFLEILRRERLIGFPGFDDALIAERRETIPG